MKELTVVYQGFGQAVPIGTLADNGKGTHSANSGKNCSEKHGRKSELPALFSIALRAHSCLQTGPKNLKTHKTQRQHPNSGLKKGVRGVFAGFGLVFQV